MTDEQLAHLQKFQEDLVHLAKMYTEVGCGYHDIGLCLLNVAAFFAIESGIKDEDFADSLLDLLKERMREGREDLIANNMAGN